MSIYCIISSCSQTISGLNENKKEIIVVKRRRNFISY